MNFRNMDELKRYLLSNSRFAVELARTKVRNVINHFLTQFYNEFSPSVYVRTEQLLNSLVETTVSPTANGWTAEVYFDLSKLNYATRIVPQGQPWSPWAKPENTYHRDPWDKGNDAWVLETAMKGAKPHGGYAEGTAIWTESIKELNKQKIEILRKALIDAGIPVK